MRRFQFSQPAPLWLMIVHYLTAVALIGVACLVIVTSTGCAAKMPPVVLPPEPDLPGVMWTGNHGDGTLCVDVENAVKLRQREQIRQAYEDALVALLHAYGATDPK